MARRSKPKLRSSKSLQSIHTPRGTISPRVQKVGPERFGIVSVDCAKARSKWMLADFFGRVLVPPTEVKHTQPCFTTMIKSLRCRLGAGRDSRPGRGHRADRTVPPANPARLAKKASKFGSSIPWPPSSTDSLPTPATKPTTRTWPPSIVGASMASACWKPHLIRCRPVCNYWRGTAVIWLRKPSRCAAKSTSIFTRLCQDIAAASTTSTTPRSHCGLPGTLVRQEQSFGPAYPGSSSNFTVPAFAFTLPLWRRSWPGLARRPRPKTNLAFI